MSKRAIRDVLAASVNGPTHASPDGGELVIKQANLSGITTSLMDASGLSTGDWPSFLICLLAHIHDSVANMVAADQSNSITVQRSDSFITSGDRAGQQLTQFTVRAYTGITSPDPVSNDIV